MVIIGFVAVGAEHNFDRILTPYADGVNFKVILDLCDERFVACDPEVDIILVMCNSRKGLNVNAEASVSMTAKGSASAEFSASGTTTVKGAMVMIN